MPNWRKVITSGSDASLNTLNVINGITGSLQGSASYALTASFATSGGTPGGANTTIQFNDTGTFSGSGNFTFNKTTNTVNLTGSLSVTGSTNTLGAVTVISGSVGINTTADAQSLLHIDGGASVNRVIMDANNNVARIFSFRTDNTQRWAFRVDDNETGANAGANFQLRRYADNGSFIDAPISLNRSTGNITIIHPISASAGITGSLFGSSSYAQTASFALNAVSASFATQALSSSFASTASFAPNYVLTSVTSSMLAPYVLTSQTSSMSVASASVATSASYALTASFALNGGGTINTGSLLTTASVNLNTITFTKGNGSTFPITVNTGSGGGGGAAFPFSGSAIISGSLFVSSSTTNVLTIQGSGSAQPIFTVQGSAGQLFAITDSLSGSLFSVNDISGLPILEVFSDNTVLIGDYQAPALYTTKRVTSVAGNNVIYSLATSSYDGAFFDYVAKSGSNARAGNIMALWSGTSVNFTETTTTDFGSTSGLAFTVFISGSNLVLSGSTSTANWNIKTIIRSI